MKTDNCSERDRKVLEICQRRSTSMISNERITIRTLDFAVLLIDFYCIIVKESHNFL